MFTCDPKDLDCVIATVKSRGGAGVGVLGGSKAFNRAAEMFYMSQLKLYKRIIENMEKAFQN